MTKTLIDRFTEKVAEPFDAHNDCFEWNSWRAKDGYGRFWLNGKCAIAHRVSYELFVGPIPEGPDIDHLCGNRGCVRPDHLQVLTPEINRGQSQRSRTHCPAGHPYDEKNTKWYRGRRYCRACHAKLTLAAYYSRKER